MQHIAAWVGHSSIKRHVPRGVVDGHGDDAEPEEGGQHPVMQEQT